MSLLTPAEFKKLQQENQDTLNNFVVEQCQKQMENGKFIFQISIPESYKGNHDHAASFLRSLLVKSGWNNESIGVTVESYGTISLDLYDFNAGNIEEDDDEYEDDEDDEDFIDDDDDDEEEEDDDEEEEEDEDDDE